MSAPGDGNGTMRRAPNNDPMTPSPGDGKMPAASARVSRSSRADLDDRLAGWRTNALRAAAVAGALAVVGLVLQPQQFFRSYLIAYQFWVALALGSWGLVCLYHMVGGDWGRVIRRILESAAATLPLMALLFVPLLFGLGYLYPWARPEVVAADPLLQHKEPWLNIPFFAVRAALYFALAIGAVTLLNRWSARQDDSDDPALARRLQLVSGAALPLYGLIITFASVDWAMSLEPHWYSTIYGMMFVAGQGLATFAFAILALGALADQPPLADVVRPKHFHDLGNLTLAFVMLWAYMAYSQYVIVWSGNLPEEISWYLHRNAGGWQFVGVALVLLHFALPFLLLLSRRTKRSRQLLARVALLLLVLRYVDLFWLMAPAFSPGRLTVSWLDAVLPVAIGGLWIATWTRKLGSWPLLPGASPSAAPERPGGTRAASVQAEVAAAAVRDGTRAASVQAEVAAAAVRDGARAAPAPADGALLAARKGASTGHSPGQQGLRSSGCRKTSRKFLEEFRPSTKSTPCSRSRRCRKGRADARR